MPEILEGRWIILLGFFFLCFVFFIFNKLKRVWNSDEILAGFMVSLECSLLQDSWPTSRCLLGTTPEGCDAIVKTDFFFLKNGVCFCFLSSFFGRWGRKGGVRGGFLEQISDDDDDDDDGDMLLRFFFVPETTLSYHRPFWASLRWRRKSSCASWGRRWSLGRRRRLM